MNYSFAQAFPQATISKDVFTWLQETQLSGTRLHRFIGFSPVDEANPACALSAPSQLLFLNPYNNLTFHSHPLQNFRWVLEVPNARVLGYSGYVSTADGVVLTHDSFFGHSNEHYEYYRSQLNAPVGEPEFIPGRTALVTTQWEINYYHAVMDLIPKLKLLQASGLQYDTLIINASKPFHAELLEIAKPYLQLPCKRIIMTEIGHDTPYQLEHLLLPSYVDLPGFPMQDKIEWIRSLFPYPTQRKERLFIARSKAHRRRILNEDALFAMLTSWGFRKVFLEDMSVAEQFRLMSQATVVVSAHGAGLTNMVVAPKGCQLIELAPESYEGADLYQRILKAQGLECHHFTVMMPRDAEGKLPELPVDFSVDLDQFQGFLSMNVRRMP